MKGPAPRRVLLTTDAVGGVWQYSLELAESLAAGGIEVTIALLGPAPDADQRGQAARIAGVTLVETGQPLDWLADGPQPVERAAAALADLATQTGASLVHCNAPTLAAAARFPVPVVAVAHGCVTTWWQAARTTSLAPEYRWHRDMTRAGLDAADAVVAPSAAHAALLARTYRLRRLPQVVHNGRRALAHPGTGEPADAVLTVGRLWDTVKNAAMLDLVAARIAMPLRAAGALRGPHGEEARLAHLDVLGHLPDESLARLLAERPVFVSAARFEPFGLAVLEAAGAGCALVLSDIPTFRELWDGAAMFAAPDDEDAFAAAIERLRADPAERARLGAAAARRAARYTPEATAAAMLRVYAGLLGQQEAAA